MLSGYHKLLGMSEVVGDVGECRLCVSARNVSVSVSARNVSVSVSARNVSARNVHAPPLCVEYRLRRIGVDAGASQRGSGD